MLASQRIGLRLSEVRQRLNEISGLEGDDFTAEIRSEAESLQREFKDLEVRHRSAVIAEGEVETRALATEPDAQMRERLELRSRASLTNYLRSALSGRLPSGTEAELNAAAGIEEGNIPLELWETRSQQQRLESRADMPTGAPGTVGVNLDAIRPAIFAQAVLPRLGVEMPRVESGSYVSATISTSLSAGSQAKDGAQEATPAAFTPVTDTPKRISGRLGIRIEDVAAVGQANFESALRENLALVMSDELDDQGLNGAGGNSGADLIGLFQRLSDPSAPGAAVATFDDFVSSFADGIDGLWAPTMQDVSIVCGPETYRLSAKTFRDATGQDLGDTSFADYAMQRYGGWWTNKRMPDAASNIQQAILYRKARSFLNMGEGFMRTAVCPHWNEISIDDIYSGSAAGQRYFTMHVLLGDVIVVQPDAYAQVSYRTAV